MECPANFVPGNKRDLNFRLPGAPYTNWAIILAIGVIAVQIATNGTTRITFYVIASWLGILIVAYDVKSYEQSTTTGSN
jgi:AAT family amino acid transporter